MKRVATGNPKLDGILGGGLPANAIHVLMGAPGTGKTILAEHLAFTAATAGRPALYLTTLSEPHAKFLAFLQEYTFADPMRVGTDVVYEELGTALRQHPESFAELVTRLVETHRPGLVVIDSFKAVADLMPDVRTWRVQLYTLAGVLSAYATTAIWVGEYGSDTISHAPEFAVADGIIELTREQHGSRDFRFLRIVKLRGSQFLDGYHAIRISRSGLEVFPRLVSPRIEATYTPLEERLPSGVPGLDSLIATGWLRGTTTLVLGPSGSGKTILSLQFAREAMPSGEPCVFVSFEENPIQLARVMHHLGWDPAQMLGPGRIDVVFASPVELQIDVFIRELFERIATSKARRLVIDGLADLAATAADPLRFRDYLFTLTQRLAVENVTMLATLQSDDRRSPLPMPGVEHVADNVLRLETIYTQDLERTIRVLKSRGSAHDGRSHRLAIGPGGVRVE